MLNNRNALALVSVLALGPAGPLAAQVAWTARLGGTYTAAMVSDEIAGRPITLKPGIAPTLLVEARTPLHTKTPLEASFELQATTATLTSDDGVTTAEVAGMRTFALTGGVRGRIVGPLGLRMGVGFISYLGSEKMGVFQDNRPTRILGTAALEYRRRLTPSLGLSGALSYDVHAFTTKRLEANGFTGSQTVHRVSVGIGVTR